MTTGIQEALSPHLSLSFFQAISDSPEEANIAYEEHKASAEAAAALPEE